MQRRPYANHCIVPTLICTNPKCDNISSKLYIVEEKIIEALKHWLDGYKVDFEKVSLNRPAMNIRTHENSIVVLEKEIEKEKNKLAKVYDFLEERRIYKRDVYRPFQKHLGSLKPIEKQYSETQRRNRKRKEDQ